MGNKRIVVIGAGISGLTAAHFLRQQGENPLVLESSPRLGGRMSTEIVDGVAVNAGAQFLTDKYTILNGIIDHSPESFSKRETSQYSGVFRKGKIRVLRNDGRLSPLTTGLLSLSAWFRLGIHGYRLFSRTNMLPLNDFSAWSDYDDLTAESWGHSYFGKEVTDYLMEPYVDGFYFQSLAKTSSALPIATMAYFYRKARYVTLQGGIGEIPERLAVDLDVKLNSPVRSIAAHTNGVEVEVGDERIVAERVILATPAPSARKMYKGPNSAERELMAVDYSSTVNVVFAVEGTYRLSTKLSEMCGILIPKTERGVIAAIGIEHVRNEEQVNGLTLFNAIVSGTAGPGLINLQDDEIFLAIVPELERYFPGISRHFRFKKIYRWQVASAASPVGRSRKIAQYRTTVDEGRRVFLAGDYMGLPCTEGAAETGKWAAQNLLRYLA